jgi:UDP-N-acetyl-D-mannosaminuronate dehydrogenase|tara:strand:+ start:2351 stop:3100 length:750 start_codon:yes stop_codon:yes gene_type:complete
MKKDVVVGIGEVGKPILKLLSKDNIAVGFDLNPSLMNKRKFEKYQNLKTSFLHIAIPISSKFESNLLQLYKKFKPECIVIHSTIGPGTIKQIQKKLDVPLIYSATRGVHKRMLKDIKRYTKFFAISKNAPKKQWAIKAYSKKMKNCGIKTKQMSKPETLELAKIICDTSYLGWLINYAQFSNMIAQQYNVNYDEMWSFSDEIHKFLGNRPKMYPGFIGGHCVIPNLDLIHNQTLDLIKKMNNNYAKRIK